MKLFKKSLLAFSGLVWMMAFFFFSAQIALAITTVFNNQTPAQRVTGSEADFLVLDFNISVDSESNLAGAVPAGGTSITATKPASWTQMKFYDYSGGGAWSLSSWIGTDVDSDNRYTNQSDWLIYDGGYDYGSPTVDGTILTSIDGVTDALCTNSLSNPTCVYFAGGDGCGDFASHDGVELVGVYACDESTDFLVYSSDNWSYRDGGSGTFQNDEELYIERSHKGLTYSSGADTTIAGSAPSAGTAITVTKPAAWTTMKFYDASGGGQWNGGSDWIGLDTNGDNIYGDRLNAITFDLQEDSTVSTANVANIKFYAGTPGSGTHLGTISSRDGGGSGWYLNGLNRSLSAGNNRFYALMSLSGASNDQVVRLKVPRYDANNNSSFDLGDSGVFLTTRHLGDFANAAFSTIDTVAPTVTINIDESEFSVGDSAEVTFTFSEEVTGFTITDVTVWGGSLDFFGTTDNRVFTATFYPTSNTSYLSGQNLVVDMSELNDVAGNPGVGFTNSSNYAIDTRRPTLVSAVFSDDELKIGDTATVTFTFSEEVTGFSNADLSIPNGTLTDVATADGGLTWTATFTPSASIEDVTNVISVDMTAVEDIKLGTKSNSGSGSANSSNYEVDTVAPTLDITMSDYSLIIGETSAVTFTFSEAVDFADDDITVSSGTLSAIATVDGGLTYTATFTPAVTTEDATNVVTVDMSEVKDKKLSSDWNTGGDDVDSSNYAVDTVRATFNMQYYSDLALSTAINGASYLKAGTYYVKISASEALGSNPTITLAAEGSANDVTNAATTHIAGNDYLYTRVITADVDAVGVDLENVSISGTDAAGNVSADYNPVNEGTKAIYIDTVAPLVSAGSDRGTVSAEFTQQSVASDGSNPGIISYLWEQVSGYYNSSFGTATADDTTVNVIGGGPYEIKLTVADSAGNTATDSFTFTWGGIPGSSSVARGGVGSGSSDFVANNNNTVNNVGLIGKQGINFLSYIGTKSNFQIVSSKQGFQTTHYLTIDDLDLLNNIVKFTVESVAQVFQLKLGEALLVDLDNDGVKDAEIKFVDIWVNRAELTIRSIYEPVITAAVVGEETTKEGDALKAEVISRELANMKELNAQLAKRLSGRILLQVEEKGEAWYVEPASKVKHFMGRPNDAFAMMRKFGLGVSNANFDKFETGGVPTKFAGRIFIKVEDAGKAYYVNPLDLKMHYLGRPDDAFRIMRELALGVSNDNIRQIEVAK